MASMVRRATCVPPGPSRYTYGRPSCIRDRAGNWARTVSRAAPDSGEGAGAPDAGLIAAVAGVDLSSTAMALAGCGEVDLPMVRRLGCGMTADPPLAALSPPSLAGRPKLQWF